MACCKVGSKQATLGFGHIGKSHSCHKNDIYLHLPPTFVTV